MEEEIIDGEGKIYYVHNDKEPIEVKDKLNNLKDEIADGYQIHKEGG